MFENWGDSHASKEHWLGMTWFFDSLAYLVPFAIFRYWNRVTINAF